MWFPWLWKLKVGAHPVDSLAKYVGVAPAGELRHHRMLQGMDMGGGLLVCDATFDQRIPCVAEKKAGFLLGTR